MVWSSSDHGVFVWHIHNETTDLGLATDDNIVCSESCTPFLLLKWESELLFDITCSEGFILKFLNLHIVQSPAGISFDQPDLIRSIILAQYLKDIPQTSIKFQRYPFPLQPSVERKLYESVPLNGVALMKAVKHFHFSFGHVVGGLMHITGVSCLDLVLLLHALLRLHGFPKLGNFWGFSFDHVLFTPSSSSPNYVYFLQPKYFWCFPTKILGQRSCWKSICWLWWWSLHFMDADHAHDHWTQRSDSFYFIFLNIVLISWGCKKQLITALYSTGAEVISLHHGGEKSKITYHFFEYIFLPLSASCALFEDN